jgi:hypothetical protein
MAIFRFGKVYSSNYFCSDGKLFGFDAATPPTPNINSGAGIYTALVVYDYLFKNWPTFQSITINILKTNKVSIKMNLKLGFEAVEESKLYDCIQFKFILNKNTFPNTYCKKILSKFQYEIR